MLIRTRAFRLVLILAAVIAAALGGFAGGLWAGRGQAAPRTDFDLLHQAYELIEVRFLGDLPDSLRLQRGMIHGMLAELDDPYTLLIEPAASELQSDDLSGEYGGIGAHLSQNARGRIFLVPFEQGPAARAGVAAGDLLLAVGGAPIDPGDALDEVEAALRGPVGSQVVLVVQQPGQESLRELKIVRERIELPSVSTYLWPQDTRVGVVAVNLFSDRTAEEVRDGLEALFSEGVVGIVLDLRGNTGGLLDAAVEVSELFLSRGLIVEEISGAGENRRYEASGLAVYPEGPLAVLVNSGTASAAEVVAAALSYHERAILVGARTFGKGSVQAVLPLKDGSSLHVTTARWHTPQGESLDGEGLEPDLAIEEAPDAQRVMHAAVSRIVEIIEAKP
jgi:carboxyl-terminal processing protease